jgi:hypothetical protein
MKDIIVIGGVEYESTRLLRQRFGIGSLTPARWVEQGLLQPPLKVGSRHFWRRDQIEKSVVR